MNALNNGEIAALASDGIILQSFLIYGIKGTENKKQNTVPDRSHRPPYKSIGFSIFPTRNSVPELLGEYYGIAVRKDLGDSNLVTAINLALSDLHDPNLPLAKAQDNLRQFEDGKTISLLCLP